MLSAFTDNEIIVDLPSKKLAIQLLNESEKLAYWAKLFNRKATLIRFPESNRPFRIPASLGGFMQEVLLPGIQVAQMRLSLPILQVLGDFLEFPSKKSGLVRMSDNLQIAMSESSRLILRDGNLERAVQRRREQYWYLPDLDEVNRISRQELSPNNPNSFVEFTWHNPSTSESNQWRRFTNRYRLVTDSYGDLYQVSESLGFEYVSPLIVSR